MLREKKGWEGHSHVQGERTGSFSSTMLPDLILVDVPRLVANERKNGHKIVGRDVS